jgi:cation-transporting ATPase E
VALRDELRPEARATLDAFREAGIRVKVISGDHTATVAALAAQAGLGEDLVAVSGPELAAMDDREFAQVAEGASIFGRVTPQQKERLVEALRAQGHYLAMIGDGVNDLLSLKKADLGIAMQSGSAAARDVADMVLLKDTFAALPVAFREGQRIRNGMRDCLALYLTRLLYFPPLILAVGLVTGTFAFTPRTAAFIALLTVGLPPFALVAWARPGAPPERGMIRPLAPFVVPAGLGLTLLGLGVYVAAFFTQLPVGPIDATDAGAFEAAAVARSTLAAAMVLGGQVVILALRAPATAAMVGGATADRGRHAALALAMLAAYVVVQLFPITRRFFDLVPLDATEYLLIGASVILWAIALGWTWRARLLERYFGVQPGQAGAARDGRRPRG